MSAPLGSIRTWSDAQFAEDVNDEDSISAAKYNEHQRRVKARKEEVEQRAWEEAEWMAREEAEQRACEEQQRVEAERRKAEEQAKKHVSHFCFVMMELPECSQCAERGLECKLGPSKSTSCTKC